MSSSEDESQKPSASSLTKKRKRHGRLSDATKKLRDQSYVLGEDCRCKLFRCFDNVSEEERNELIKQFNLLGIGMSNHPT